MSTTAIHATRPITAVQRALIVLLAAALFLTGLVVPGALAAPGDDLAPQPKLPEPDDILVIPMTKATIAATPSCTDDPGPGIAFEATLHSPPQGTTFVPQVRWRPEGGQATTVAGPTGYLPVGEGDFEVQAVFLPLPAKGQLPPLPPGQPEVSEWIPVTVICDDPGDPEDKPDPEDEPEDEPGPEDDPSDDDSTDVLPDVVTATPTFTG